MEAEAYRELAALEESHWWYRGRRSILGVVLDSLGLPGNARILEVGCGTGGNLELLARFGTVSAVEMSAEACEFVRQRKKPLADLFVGRFPEGVALGESRFDLICLLDVLEHLDDDVAALVALRPALAPGGRILLTVPAHPALWSRHDERLHHRRRYTRQQLRAALDAAGYRLERLTAFNSLLFPVAVLARRIERWRRGGPSIGAQLPSAPINGLLASLFAAERLWLRRADLPVGLSLLAVLTAE